ncbi:unnamed protein product [Ixodes hexagonus]
MDADWDLHSVLELCCSKLSPEAELPTLDDEGHLDWLDEKVDLSAWADLDFPDDLPPAAMTTGAGHHLPRVHKLEDWWQSTTCSPEYLSPPDSPNTPVAIVPNVDVFLNLSPAPSVESRPSADASSPVGFPEDASEHPADGGTLLAESSCLSPPRTPASPRNANGAESDGVVEPFPRILVEDLAAPSTSFGADCREDPTDGDFVPRESDSESEEEPRAGRRGPRHARKPPQRRKRKAADTGSSRERKRLQNKDAATRYRQKKKQEYDTIDEEFQKLSRVNDSLKAEAARVANEVSYLKGLMRELFRAKGLLP